MNENKKLDIHKWIVLGIIVVFVLVGSLTPIFIPDTAFASVIEASIGRFFNLFDLIKNNYVNLLESIAIILFIGILYYILSVLTRLAIKRSARGDTIVVLITSIIKFACMVIALILVLAAWNVPTPTILAGAGIIGLAISFGAQGLLEDVFAGLSIIFERQFIVGDFVELQNFRGQVKEIGPRNTKIKDIYGNVLIIANSDIREIINLSEELSYAICEIGIEYSSDLDKVEQVIKENMDLIQEKIPYNVYSMIYDGVETLGDSSVVVRIIAHCEEKDRLQVRRALNKEMKLLFDKNNINIPFPQLVIHNNN